MTTLLIDDLRNFRDDPPNVVIARTSEEAIDLLSSQIFDDVWWDHDLGEDDTTQKVADWLLYQAITSHKIKIDTCFIHTSNPVGAVNLKTTLTSRFLKYECVRIDQKDSSEIFYV